MSALDWRLGDILKAIGIFILLALPFLGGVAIWLWLSPDGFWQMLGMVLGELVIIPVLYGLALLAVAVIDR